ncbi:hypothetical protein DEI92_15555 [Curtobacterium sp. MCBD17_034]|uniref:Dabb family protein n=1 Tax=unclassified Curtobacterium TaxID=257496 RepID=UPI000DA7ECF6|nr:MULTISPECIES: Dabb family protein [unclassified Curtobacterium]PZF56044.1 hypothetical protein DEI92_15555 [Curtobacterium sp. MCBD17_034]PZM32912.1 hypothetical protein DEI90_15420 [Curtobacterium sp. MCBD17_031]
MSEIVHVVLVQWSGDHASSEQRAAELVRQHLPGIDGVTSVDAGPSVSSEGLEGRFDWMLVVGFRDRAALDGYLPHPDHQPVAAFLGGASADLVVFDIEAGS